MQLEEQRRAIEYQKKKMETVSARQRLKLGKAAFLNIVKKVISAYGFIFFSSSSSCQVPSSFLMKRYRLSIGSASAF
uniref:Uncharacterized protein n=1 Tax=Mola mola TaxID=94237 RepID=A0A3Q3VT31_MOLML